MGQLTSVAHSGVLLFDYENNQVPKGYLADALALRGDEGRGTLR